MNQETKVLLGLGILTLVVIIGGVLIFGNSSSNQPKLAKKVDEKILIRENSTKITSPSAKVTLVEFSDFQCPACGAAHPTVKQIIEENKEKVNFVYRHFPLSQHKNSRIAAEAAEAAGEQGKFFEMGDLLFTNQTQWSESNNPIDIFVNYAKQLNLDTDKFKKAVEGNKFENKIQGDENDGNTLGVDSTPTFFINGEKVTDLNSFSDLKIKVDQQLKK